MPKKVDARRPASRARRNSDHRKNKKGPGRTGSNGSKKKTPRVIANSIFALTLDAQPGIAVAEKLDNKPRRYSHDKPDDYFAMYDDLYAALKNAFRLTTRNETKYDPLSEGESIGFSLYYVVSAFKNNIVPKDFDVNIDRDDEGYHFTIYTYPAFNDWWHAFEIKSIVRHLRRHNKQLHNFFVAFMRYFYDSIGINTWWDGAMGHAEYIIQEEISRYEEEEGGVDYDDEHKEEESAAEEKQVYEERRRCVFDYSKGEARDYSQMLKHAKRMSDKQILTALRKFNRRNIVVRWMYDALEFCKRPANMETFFYGDFQEMDEGLSFDRQAAIIWDWKDGMTLLETECIDVDANQIGIIPPILHQKVGPKTKELSLEGLASLKTWPAELSQLWKQYDAIVESINPKSRYEQQD